VEQLKKPVVAMVSKILTYLKNDIWNIPLQDRPGFSGFSIAVLRAVVLTVRAFLEKRCALSASALTYYSLLSIVPLTAIVFAVAKGFGLEQLLTNRLMERLQGQTEAIRWIISFSESMIEHTRGGLVAGVGVAALFWTVIKLLTNIELAFNHVWGIDMPRTLGRKLSDYLAALFVCPVLFIVAGSITVALTAKVGAVVERLALLKTVAPIVFTVLNIIPYCFMWLLFGFLYLFMPNTKVRPADGMIAGVIAGSLYQIVQWLYIKFQIGIASYGAIYGGFAALPLFLVWLNTSWAIVLFGAVISWSLHNLRAYEFDSFCRTASHACKRILALCIVRTVVKAFLNNEQPPTADALAAMLKLPLRLVKNLLRELTACGLLRETSADRGGSAAYSPGRNPDTLTISAVMEAYDHQGSSVEHIASLSDHDEIVRRIRASYALFAGSDENKPLKDI